MKNRIKQVVEKLIYGPLSPMMSFTFQFISNLEYRYFTKKWGRQGWKQPDQAEVDFVRENVTIIFKNGQKLNLNVCYANFDKQVLRATRLESSLRGRKHKKYL